MRTIEIIDVGPRQLLEAHRQRLVQQKRWLLGIGLALAVLLLGFFPLALMHVERGAGGTPAAPPAPASYSNGIYWSFVTPLPGVKSGPQTVAGRRLTYLAGVTRLLTLGTLARSFHTWEQLSRVRTGIRLAAMQVGMGGTKVDDDDDGHAPLLVGSGGDGLRRRLPPPIGAPPRLRDGEGSAARNGRNGSSS